MLTVIEKQDLNKYIAVLVIFISLHKLWAELGPPKICNTEVLTLNISEWDCNWTLGLQRGN